MATVIKNLLSDESSDASFRDLQGFQSLFGVGSNAFWIQTADTGQINWSTVTHSASTNVDIGFEIYKTNDTLSGTFQLFMKVTYGNATNASNGTPRLKFQFGTGSNGSGTLTGQVGNVHTHDPNVANQGTLRGTMYASGAAGYFSLLGWTDFVSTRCPFSMVVERSLDNNGNYTASYFTYHLSIGNGAGATTTVQRTILPASLSTELANAYTLYNANSSAAWGTYTTMYPVFPFRGFPDNPMISLMGMKSGDVDSARDTFDCTLYGVTHHYMWYNTGNVSLGSATGLTNLGVGIRYE